MPRSPRHLPHLARLAVIALVGWAVLDACRTIVMIGHYEDRIIVVSHDDADVGPPWFAYLLLEELLPRDMVTTVVDRSWTIGLLVAAAAFVAWLYSVRRRPGDTAAWARWWASVLATVALNLLSWLYAMVTADGGTHHGAALDSRTVAYPLWTAGTVAVAFTAYLGVLVVRRITEAQQRSAMAITIDSSEPPGSDGGSAIESQDGPGAP